MESNSEYLKYLINEEIYRVEDPVAKTDDEIHGEDHTISPYKKFPDDQTPSPETDLSDVQIINVSGKTFILVDSQGRSPYDILDDVFFNKVISSVNLTREDLIMINLADDKNSEPALDKYRMKDCYMLAFSNELPDAVSPIFGRIKYNVQLTGGARVLWADTLNKIEKDRSLKLKLWEAMKVMYGIES